MFEKQLWKSDILSKDAGRWPVSSMTENINNLFNFGSEFANPDSMTDLTSIGYWNILNNFYVCYVKWNF